MNDKNHKEATRMARTWFLLVIGSWMLVIASCDLVAAERKWETPIKYTIESCTNKDTDIDRLFKQAADEISFFTTPIEKASHPSLANIVVTCTYTNPFDNRLMRLFQGETIDIDEANKIGVTLSRYYTKTNLMISAEIWLNELFIEHNPLKVIRHELGHALGISKHSDDDCERDCPETVMNAAPIISYWDARTISTLMARYENKRYSYVDEEGDRYTPCLLVPKEIAALFGYKGGFFSTIERNQSGAWHVAEFNPATECVSGFNY